MKHLRKIGWLGVAMLASIVGMPAAANAQASTAANSNWKNTQMKNVKTVWVILMENHNWTGNNAGAAFGAPDIKGNPLAPYINGKLLHTAAHAERYFNPPGNHPSLPNYLWLEAGTNFGILQDNLPTDNNLTTHKHLVHLLENAGISWKAYAEQDFGNVEFEDCPLDFSEIDVNHLAFDYFADVTNNFNSQSPHCIAHVRPYSQLPTDLADHTTARYNFITPNLCHDGHEGVSPCDPDEPTDNTFRSDQWLKQNVPLITESAEYKKGGALFIIWDEGEDSGIYSDGPVGMFVLSPFAKGSGHSEYTNYVHYDHSSMVKSLQEIFNVGPLLGAAANPATRDLSDLFKKIGDGDHDGDDK